jgi:hypothetical protein
VVLALCIPDLQKCVHALLSEATEQGLDDPQDAVLHQLDVGQLQVVFLPIVDLEGVEVENWMAET